MGIVDKISVGDIDYYYVDDIPTHSAKRGSVSLNITHNLMYFNNGGSKWIRLLNDESAEMYFVNNGTSRSTSQNSWSNLNNIGWTEGVIDGEFDLKQDSNGDLSQLTYTGETDIKVLICGDCSVEGDSKKLKSIETGVALNNIAPPIYHGETIRSGTNTASIGDCRLELMKKNDYINVGMRSIEGNNNTNYTPKHYTVIANKVDEARDFYNNIWEEDTFSGNSWVIVNGSEANQWIIGTSESTKGSQSAYVSSDGSTPTYNDTPSVVHFYQDFFFDDAKYSEILLSFDWKCWADNGSDPTQYDYGTVVIADTGETPTTGTELYTSTATDNDIGEPTGNGRIGANTNDGKFNEGYPATRGGGDDKWRKESIDISNYLGQTKRIIFTWKSEDVIEDQPPFVVDNIKLNFFV